MIITNMNDPLHDAAIKDSEEKKKQYDDAMKANKEGLKAIDELNKLENTGKKIKSSELKKMHLSESAFMDIDVEEEDIDECVEEVDSFVESLNKSKLSYVYPKKVSRVVEQISNIIPTKMRMSESLKDEDPKAFSDFQNELYNAITEVFYDFVVKKEVRPTESDLRSVIDWMVDHQFFEEPDPESYLDDPAVLGESFSRSLKESAENAYEALISVLNLDEELVESVSIVEDDSYIDSINDKIFDDSDLDWLDESLKKKSLNESFSYKDLHEIANKVINEYPGKLDIYNMQADDKPYATIKFLIENGDWKHDHLAFRFWMDQHAEELTNCIVKFGGEEVIDDSQDDTYSATHEFFFIPNEDKSDEEIEDVDDTEVPDDIETQDDSLEELDIDEEEPVSESIKFNIAKEQLKRYNEGKMPRNWNADRYLERLVKKHHITSKEKAILKEAFLKK